MGADRAVARRRRWFRFREPWDRGGLRTYLVVLALVFAQPRSLTLWYGSALLLLGVALHVYAKGCLRQDQVVAMGGPYRFVRHPFYSANLIIDESIALLSGCWPLAALLPAWWLAVYVPAMRREEAFLNGAFPEIYPPYQRRVPRLVPFRRPLPRGGEGFSWANPNITSDDVIPRALRLSAFPLLFIVWNALRTRGIRPFVAGDVLLLSAAALLLALFGVARMLTRHLKERRRVLPGPAAGPVLRAATAVLVLVVAATVRWGEIEPGLLLLLVGVPVLIASAMLCLGSEPARLAAEGVGLAGVAALCELPWLGVLPVLVYAALALDARAKLADERQGTEPAPRRNTFLLTYSLLLVGGVVLAVAKELR
jgi:hypothetical protein